MPPPPEVVAELGVLAPQPVDAARLLRSTTRLRAEQTQGAPGLEPRRAGAGPDIQPCFS